MWIFHTTYTAKRKMRVRMGTYFFFSLGTEQVTFAVIIPIIYIQNFRSNFLTIKLKGLKTMKWNPGTVK